MLQSRAAAPGRRDVGRRRTPDLAAFDGPLQFLGAVFDNFTGSRNTPLANIEQLGASANWQTLAMLVGAGLRVASFAATIARWLSLKMPAS